MKVVCVDNKGCEKYLTIGKTYNAIECDYLPIFYNSSYCIICDDNDEWELRKDLFKSLFEIRNEKINKLLHIF